MQQQHRLGARLAADVHVLAEHGELLGKVAVEPATCSEARPVVDLPVVPALERMRAAAGHLDIETVGADHQRVAHRQQFGRAARRDAVCTEVLTSSMLSVISGLMSPGNGLRVTSAIRSDAARVRSPVRRLDQLQFELDADRQQRRLLELEQIFAHGAVPRFAAGAHCVQQRQCPHHLEHDTLASSTALGQRAELGFISVT